MFPELHQIFFEMHKIFLKIMRKIFVEYTKFSKKIAQNNF